MPFWESIRQLDKKFAWSFLGVMLGLIFGVIGIYIGFFQERKPNLKFEIISNTSVLDVHEKISNLDILYAGNSIKENGQSLRVITLRIVNDGQQDILKTYYDENDPVGFVLVNGVIVERPELLHASNDYLTKNLKITLESQQKILFSNVILERNEFYILKILVLSNEGETPDISPIGKIAGVKAIEVSRPYKERNEESFLNHVYAGNLLTQILRTFVYGLGFIIIFVIASISISSISDWISKLRRSRHIAVFKRDSESLFDEKDDYIFQSYINYGKYYLLEIIDLLSDERVLEWRVREFGKLRQKHADELSRTSHKEFKTEVKSKGIENYEIPSRLNRIAGDLLNNGFISKTNGSIEIDGHMKETLAHLIRFLLNNRFIEIKERDFKIYQNFLQE